MILVLLPHRFSRINNRYRYQCLIKYKREPKLTSAFTKILDHYQQEITQHHLQVFIDLNPQIMM